MRISNELFLNLRLADSKSLLKRIELQKSSSASIWRKGNIPLAHYVLDTALGELQAAHAGAEGKDPIVVSWRARNLLEISIIAKYLAASAQNRADFAEQALGDVLYVMTTLSAFDAQWGPNKELLESVSNRVSSNYKSHGSISAHDFAKKLVLKVDDRFRILSKLSHPTPLAMIGGLMLDPQIDTSIHWPAYVGILLQWANEFALEVLNAIPNDADIDSSATANSPT